MGNTLFSIFFSYFFFFFSVRSFIHVIFVHFFFLLHVLYVKIESNRTCFFFFRLRNEKWSKIERIREKN